MEKTNNSKKIDSIKDLASRAVTTVIVLVLATVGAATCAWVGHELNQYYENKNSGIVVSVDYNDANNSNGHNNSNQEQAF